VGKRHFNPQLADAPLNEQATRITSTQHTLPVSPTSWLGWMAAGWFKYPPGWRTCVGDRTCVHQV